MAHTYTSLMYHCVFSTKQRRRMLSQDLFNRLVPFVGDILRKRGGKLLAMNGPKDHAHLLALLPPTGAVSDQLRDIKAGSSKWIHETFPDQRAFAWQEGYSAFSVSKSVAPKVVSYIENQEERRRTMSFEEELVQLLDKHGIEYDPQWLSG